MTKIEELFDTVEYLKICIEYFERDPANELHRRAAQAYRARLRGIEETLEALTVSGI